LACGVKAVRSLAITIGQPKKRLIDKIIIQVLNQLNFWDAMTQLHNIFELKHYIMHTSYTMDGSNEYLIFCFGQSHTDPALRRDSINLNALSLGSNDFGNQFEENVVIKEVMVIENDENEVDDSENEIDNSENKVDNDEIKNGDDENVMTEDEDAVEDGQKKKSDDVRQIKNNENQIKEKRKKQCKNNGEDEKYDEFNE
jgi:hypothetical protein